MKNQNFQALKIPMEHAMSAAAIIQEEMADVVSYWIIPDDPLREMKIRQARTGQPVWARAYGGVGQVLCHEYFPPFAHPDAFEYAFTEFKEEV